MLDLHTGLGPPGYGEPIYFGASNEDLERAIRWYGPSVRSPAKGDLDFLKQNSPGHWPDAIRLAFPRAQYDLHCSRVRDSACHGRACCAPCRQLVACDAELSKLLNCNRSKIKSVQLFIWTPLTGRQQFTVDLQISCCGPAAG